MKYLIVFLIIFAAHSVFSQEKKPEDMIQPDYVLPCSSLTVGANGKCTLKENGYRKYANGLYLHPKCDTGKFIYSNGANNQTGDLFYPLALPPGQWIGMITGILDTTGTGINIDSLWWNKKR